jgi:hypothetical protein
VGGGPAVGRSRSTGPRPRHHPGPEANTPRNRHAVLTAVTPGCVLGLLFLGFLREFRPDTHDGLLLLGAYLIAVGGAVVLNAITVRGDEPAGPESTPRQPTALSHHTAPLSH